MKHKTDVLRLALARYQKTPAPLALMYFESDRRAAGLGALDHRKRGGRGDVKCYKTVDLMTGRVQYDRIIDVKPRDEFPRFDMGVMCIDDIPETIQIIRRPGRFAQRAVRFDRHDFDTQRGRSMVAKVLMQLRRETMA